MTAQTTQIRKVGGKVAYDEAVDEGKTGADLFWFTVGGAFVGGAFGLAAGGVTLMLGAVGVGAAAAIGLGSETLFFCCSNYWC